MNKLAHIYFIEKNAVSKYNLKYFQCFKNFLSASSNPWDEGPYFKAAMEALRRDIQRKEQDRERRAQEAARELESTQGLRKQAAEKKKQDEKGEAGKQKESAVDNIGAAAAAFSSELSDARPPPALASSSFVSILCTVTDRAQVLKQGVLS